MIMTAVRDSVGCDELNGIAFERMRSWILGVARGLLDTPELSASGRNQISSLFRELGLLAEAGAVAEATLAQQEQDSERQNSPRRFFGRRKSKKRGDLSTASTLNNMALVHDSKGNYDEALRLYDQALKIRMKALGPDHADTARTRRARDALVCAR